MLTIGKRDASGNAAKEADHQPRVAVGEEGGVLGCAFSGIWTTTTVALIDAEMRKIEQRKGFQTLALDLSHIEKMDTAGAWLIDRLVSVFEKKGVEIKMQGQSDVASILLGAVGEAVRREPESRGVRRPNIILRGLEAVGRRIYEMRDDFLASMNILGATIGGAQMKLGRGHAINPAAIFNQIDRMGVGAIPVVVLMSAIVGAIVAQQGAYQLNYFGANIFVVDLVGVLILRELGVLMTAIMIAGRSGSAITAEIGSMKMREEVDALKVIGLNPIGVLVFPRLVALVIALPCLTIVANFAALGGGILAAWLYSGIAPTAFIDRLRGAIDISTIFAGLIKAPFMAMIIGTIASVEGMKVGGSAESLGLHVTASVVKSIFVVIILDGLFAIFYASIEF
ncbi:ABC transporter permease [Mesorhizobium sp. M0761]|uniref:MlaE family ABC transporter permease n=1 Tax=unclassified Mesorhizobium TaxID=325217 RepID=UPI0003CDEEFF|nr:MULTISPECIES: ABC transporter permease [unclassified Mesorhizobium]ESX24752.1 toluene ABC transporter permease [Mesorhizobium sp. LSHC440B00]ESX47421.1 toluene ABC transporter permease [Mesorhizobium sp. LSHC426A00]ESX50647.1 toluene ABC transporter permease [Mesorhizobium sp. LSHC424B00]ESX85397.1 toluene ABC transporter permease [Mesorhizobium sp. LSHC412B00]ESY08758.1 toluene ABC transporter permease [Mesorhizobium sp. LNJC398B00]